MEEKCVALVKCLGVRERERERHFEAFYGMPKTIFHDMSASE
jgi:hypothetical protein